MKILRTVFNKHNKNKKLFSVELRAGFWYTVCNIISKGFSFFIIPILTRLLTKAEYGEYINYEAWKSLILIIVTGQLFASINVARFDFKEDLNKYISSITFLGTIFTGIVYVICLIFNESITHYTGLSLQYINIMFVYFATQGAFENFYTSARLHLRYKNVIILSFVSTVTASLTSLLFCYLIKNKVFGVIIGKTLPLFILSSIIYIIILKKGKFNIINKKYWKYACSISLPLIFHALSHNLLRQSDRFMIKYYCKVDDLALYSLIYSIATISSLFFDAINNAWSPWLMNKLNDKNYTVIKKFSQPYFLLAWLISLTILFFVPEAVYIMGGPKYSAAVLAAPPVVLGLIIQFLYTFYVNIEIFNKKTKNISIATVLAAGINIVLNFIFIPRFGYLAASITTFVGYLFLLIFHMINVKKLGLLNIYNNKFNFSLVLIFIGLSVSCYYLYKTYVLRYLIYLCCITILIIYFIKNKNTIFNEYKKQKIN